MKVMSKKENTIQAVSTEKKEAAPKAKYTLFRVEDNKSWSGDTADYILWKPDGTFRSSTRVPTEGASFALDLVQGVGSTHITTEIEKLLEVTNYMIKFKTKKETYRLSLNS